MAQGRRCNQCGYHMYAEREQSQPQGTWVWYVCRASGCGQREKVFEARH